MALYNLSQLALTRDDLPGAARSLREGIELSGETGDLANLAHFLEALAVVCSSRDEAERAAMLLGSAEGALQKVGATVYNYYVPDPVLRERAVIGAKTALGEDGFERARKRGKDLSFGQTVAYALEISRK